MHASKLVDESNKIRNEVATKKIISENQLKIDSILAENKSLALKQNNLEKELQLLQKEVQITKTELNELKVSLP